jgi:hypothetical protein
MMLEWVWNTWEWFNSNGSWIWNKVEGAASLLTMAFTGYAAYAAAKAASATYHGVEATRQAAEAAIEANRINREAFVLDHRAWMLIESLTIDSPFTWSEAGGRVKIRFKLKNSGRSPATRVKIRAVIHPDIFHNPMDRYKEIANDQLSFSSQRTDTLFPGEEIVRVGNLILPASDIQAWDESVQRDFGQTIPLHPILIVCVTYELLIDKSKHQTGIIREFRRWRSDGQEGLIGPKFGDIPEQELRLASGLFSDRIAD